MSRFTSLVSDYALKAYHRLQLTDPATGTMVEGFEAALKPPAWPHWRLLQRRGEVVLAADRKLDGERPAQTVVEVTVRDPELATRHFPDWLPGQPKPRLEVALDQATVKLTQLLPGRETKLVVALVDDQGDPAIGRTVEARPRPADNGGVVAPPVPLDEAPPGSGIYKSADRTWTPAFRPARVFVDDTLRKTVVIDPLKPENRISLTLS